MRQHKFCVVERVRIAAAAAAAAAARSRNMNDKNSFHRKVETQFFSFVLVGTRRVPINRESGDLC